MKSSLPILLVAAALLLATVSVSATSADERPDDAQLAEARGLVEAFMSELKGELMAAMRDGGAVNAIGVCSEEAPRIAADMAAESGWAVGRTSLRVRNPRNAAGPAERAVLMDFERRAAAGEKVADLEDARVVREGDLVYLHYMKAIPTSGLCLQCHGTDLGSEVRDAIAASYPADAATGFASGDLRGAFTLVKPLD